MILKSTREPVGRRLRYVVVLVAMLMIASMPAGAKMPPFTVTVEPNPPVAGETTTISVELDAAFPAEELAGLLALYPASNEHAPGEVIALTLERVDPIRYEATVVIPQAGAWVLRAFPDRTGWSTQQVPPGYPDTIDLEVVPTGAVSVPAEGTIGPVWLGQALVILVGITGLRYLANHRRPSFEENRPHLVGLPVRRVSRREMRTPCSSTRQGPQR